MVKEFWHNLISEKSFHLLQKLRKDFDFVLIGGWAIYFYIHSLKSKDIDIKENSSLALKDCFVFTLLAMTKNKANY